MVSGSTLEEVELADALRKEDPDQFHTLVRMHLSFVLDLNTDECDGAVEKTGKFRPSKWSFTSFTKRSKAISSRLTGDEVCLTQDCISKVYQLIEWLSKEQNVVQEGIFRRSGKMTRQQDLRALLDSGNPLDLDDGTFSVHDCASVLKNFLAQLPEPLLTEAHYPAHCQIADLYSRKEEPMEEERLLKALQLILLLLPPEHLQLFKDLLGLLHLTASHADINKMSADNLATLFTPHLLCPRKLSPEALHSNSQTMSGVVSFMIRQGPALFLIPTQLATDIRAYWTAREQRKLMPKNVTLNESACDGLAAKTVFTFVDRERTAEASGSVNPTEAALAQLYAHIQSLPESSKKRKLIKQFNKENGQGTPQLVVESQTNIRASRSRRRNASSSVKQRHRSRSLGDSIKKHLPGFGKMQRELKKTIDDPTTKDFAESPRGSRIVKGDVSNLTPTTPVILPSIKEVQNSQPLASSQITIGSDCDSATDDKGHNLLKRSTPTLPQTKDLSTPTKSPRLESPHPHPHPPSVERLPVKHLQGTCRDEWPVSTAPAPSLATNVATSNPALTTPSNVPSWITSTPACARACQMDGLLTPSNVNGSNSMSPITRSTQKMPRAMQEDIMTPRSRKPVVALSSSNLSQLAHFGGWARSVSGAGSGGELLRDTLLSEALALPLLLDSAGPGPGPGPGTGAEAEAEAPSVTEVSESESVRIPIEKMLAKRLPCEDACDRSKGCDCCGGSGSGSCCNRNGSLDYYSCGSGGSGSGSALTGTFREIVLSRSVLTASPVDLSFSSHTGDFDSSSERDMKLILSNEHMSESLLYCLDGNEPSCLNETGNQSRGSVVEVDSHSITVGSGCESSGVEADEESSSNATSTSHNQLCVDNGSDSLLSVSPYEFSETRKNCSTSISIHETSF